MVDRNIFRSSRFVACSILLLGSHVGCLPDLDVLTSAGDGGGGSGAGVGGALAGTSGEGGTINGEAGESGSISGTGGAGATSGTSAGGKASSGGTGGGGSAGRGGSGGTAGKGGNAGAGGATSGGATSGGGAGGGAGGGGGQAGSCVAMSNVTASGVEMVSVPLVSIGEGQRFNLQNRTNPSMPYDLSGATVTIRAYAPCAIGGNLSIFFRATSVTDSPPTKVALSTLNAGFVDIPIPVPELTGNFDPVLVDVIRIEVEAGSAYGSTFQSPATVVYIDSVVSSNGAVMHTFDTEPLPADFASSGARPLTGSTNAWRAMCP